METTPFRAGKWLRGALSQHRESVFSQKLLPLLPYRVAVTVQSRRRYGEMAMRLQCNGNAIWLLSQKNPVKKAPAVLRRGGRLPFFRSICTGFQVLNFGNNILHFPRLNVVVAIRVVGIATPAHTKRLKGGMRNRRSLTPHTNQHRTKIIWGNGGINT